MFRTSRKTTTCFCVFQISCLVEARFLLTLLLGRFFMSSTDVVYVLGLFRFSCVRCDKQYARKQHLSRHIQYECGKKPLFQCPLCPRKCKRNDILRFHLKNIHKIE